MINEQQLHNSIEAALNDIYAERAFLFSDEDIVEIILKQHMEGTAEYQFLRVNSVVFQARIAGLITIVSDNNIVSLENYVQYKKDILNNQPDLYKNELTKNGIGRLALKMGYSASKYTSSHKLKTTSDYIAGAAAYIGKDIDKKNTKW